MLPDYLLLLQSVYVALLIVVTFMFSLAFVCLFVCQQHNSKSYIQILMKFSGKVGHVIERNRLAFGGDPDLDLDQWLGGGLHSLSASCRNNTKNINCNHYMESM